MNNLGAFLSVFESYLKTEKGSKKAIQDIFKEILGVTIDSSKINMEEFSMYLDVHPVLKNEVMLNKERLTKAFKDKLNKDFDLIN
ncbi:MAG: hypothetical protein ACI88L_000297 [Candidatus Paceibacteria bacterium]|jgi:hypothetical protein